MNKRPTILLLSLSLAALALLSADPADAYNRYSGSNNCNQCHPGFEGGFGATLHDMHNTFADCYDCHQETGDNPRTSACAVCHHPDPLWNFHRVNATADQNGFTCGECHDFVANDDLSWSRMKRLFR